MDILQFEGRKRDHLALALDPNHQAFGLGGLDQVRLEHDAIPELDLAEVRLESTCLGRPIRVPFYISGMTAGHEQAAAINRTLALACAETGWALGVGSQRREIEATGSSALDVDRWRGLREDAPGVTWFANIGLSQLRSIPIERLARLVTELGAQALVVHANALQEAIQPEGTPQFRGALAALEETCRSLDFPVVLKETGCGFSRRTLKRLGSIRLAAVDVAGLGGTHWGRIEGARAPADSPSAAAARTFANWGESTVDSVLGARAVFSGEIWASGGVRTGLDAAKLLALGATRVGYAQPALTAAKEGTAALVTWMRIQELELRIALFCTGCRDIPALKARSPEIVKFISSGNDRSGPTG